MKLASLRAVHPLRATNHALGTHGGLLLCHNCSNYFGFLASKMYLPFSAPAKLNYLAYPRAANWGSFKMRVAYINYILITVYCTITVMVVLLIRGNEFSFTQVSNKSILDFHRKKILLNLKKYIICIYMICFLKN